ncbi:NAD-dependent epimerase/dehydratase family protein [Geothrix paludis]|uniref:NAD-dependent epimerase/dehydratase family protein n=1 Tax=Geothrix paludis TaxID=2922722 RepID=UPI001FAD1864|nr:NAD(P)-dependent oxidoreductase [Geothrix paludis]
MKRRSYLMTGGSGFVGQHLTKLLIERGDQVTVLDQTLSVNQSDGVTQVLGDLRDPAIFKDLPREWDGVIHLAGASIPSLFFDMAPVITNLGITLNLLDHIRDSRVLLVSSCHVYGSSDRPRHEDDPLIPQGKYGLSKYLLEQTVSPFQGRLDIRVARPFNHLGPGLRPELMVPSLLRRLSEDQSGEMVQMTGQNSVRDFIDVRDVIAAYLAIIDLEKPQHHVFNVCTGRATSIEEVVQVVLDLLGQQREIEFKGGPKSQDDIPFLVGVPDRLNAASGWQAAFTLCDSISSMIANQAI